MTGLAVLFAKNAVLGWLWRRLQELVSWAFGLAPLYMALPPAHQETILSVLRGEGGTLSISAYAGLAWYLFTQWQSFRATVKDQVVVDGQKVDPDKDMSARDSTLVKEKALTAADKKKRQPGILERLFGKR